ncbi:nickel-dependent lactate racemase [Sphaerochaeta halotolerans]|jgi:nickel-dependent lactate racemase|uniref:nickel-dependent lactate racemase n=1 Tax=Sphaerochaeta halotolerans TaxID=2293840 RepID=UPI001369F9F0|nr:nickel-dependent lactate racemase [Sphaerochaeta halotolerans]MXI87493.1 nickel-dependent lactate racemase [Sphaerochaeta halotolerans]
MQLSIPYHGKKTVEVTLSEAQLLGILEPNAIPSQGEREVLHEATAGIASFLKGAKKVLVIINDATRPTPTQAMLSALLPQFEKAGLSDAQVTILVATGAHRGVKDEELEQLLGTYTQRLKNRLVSHDAKDASSLVNVGTTRNGTPILLNKLLFSCDRIVVTGSVEPHYFAGFTGGRKAFLPGIAGFSTIEANHKLAIQDEAHSLALQGNPVHEDMMDALTHIKAPIVSLMTVLDKDQKVVAATSGDIVQSFLEAVEIARSVFCVPVKEQADVVISIAKFPMDINLYQSQKAIDNGSLAVKDGGTLILVASCREGIGDAAFAKLLGSCKSPDEALGKIEAGYKLGYHKAAKMASVSKRITVQAYTELPDELVTSLFLVPIHNLQQALDEALQSARGKGVLNPKVLVLLDGCVTVPSLD